MLAYSHSEDSVKEVVAAIQRIGIAVRAERIEVEHQIRLGDGTRYDGLFVSRWLILHGGELVDIAELDRYRLAGTTEKLEELVTKPNRGDREPVYAAVEQRLLEQLPAIPIARLDPDRVTYSTLVTADVFGFQDRQTGYLSSEDALDYADVWLADRPGISDGSRVGSAGL